MTPLLVTLPFLLGLLIAALLVYLRRRFTSFEAQRIADYRAATPAPSLETAFAGRKLVNGMIYGPTGRIASHFSGTTEGQFTPTERYLAEDFTYSGGMQALRTWRFSEVVEGRFTARAEDIVGDAVGQIAGNAVRLRYRFRMPRNGKTIVLKVNDWLYFQEDGTVLNRSVMRAYGLRVAELFAVMRPA